MINQVDLLFVMQINHKSQKFHKSHHDNGKAITFPVPCISEKLTKRHTSALAKSDLGLSSFFFINDVGLKLIWNAKKNITGNTDCYY